jgi:hypothetical protein
MTAAYHPSADGQSEKTNQTVEVALRCFLEADRKKYAKWVDYLPIVEHEYNSMVHISTGFAPNELRYLVVPRGIMDTAAATDVSAVKSDSAQQMVDDLRNRRDEARDAIAIAQAKQKKWADSKRSSKEYQVGDLVLIKYSKMKGYKPPKDHGHKLGPLSTPVRVTEKLSPLSYRVDLPAGSKIHDVLSIIHLRRFHGKGDNVRPLPILADEDGHLEYEVERIDGERKTGGSTEFLVKWKGYSADERTWEPIAHLKNAQDALDAWRYKTPSQSVQASQLDDDHPVERSTPPTRRASARIARRA